MDRAQIENGEIEFCCVHSLSFLFITTAKTKPLVPNWGRIHCPADMGNAQEMLLAVTVGGKDVTAM